MRILYMGNNLVGYQVLQWLVDQGEEIVGLVVHPQGSQKHGEDIVRAANLDEGDVFFADDLRKPEIRDRIRSLRPDLGLSIYLGYILTEDFLQMFPQRCLNLHPGYLPYNRGTNTNIWSIVDRTPAGATLHYIDRGVDTGEIVAQRPVDVEAVDTGVSLYKKLEEACLELFIESWPSVKAGSAKTTPQVREEGTFHRFKDVDKIDQINLDKEYLARDLINILRARTFPPYQGAYFEQDGARVYMQLELTPEDQFQS